MAWGSRDQSGDGAAIVAAPGAGKSVVIEEIYFWTTDPTTSVTVTPKFGTLTFLPMQLSSARPGMSIDRASGKEIRCSNNGAVYLNLGSAVAIQFMCFYNVR